SATEIVLIETWTASLASPSARPFAPSVTDSTASSLASMVIAISAALAASAGVAAIRVPSAWSAAAGSGLRFQAITECPCLMRLRAMPPPIPPSPRNAIFMALLLCLPLRVNAEWRHPCPPLAGNRINYGTLPLSLSSPQHLPLRDIFEMPAFPDLYGPSDRARVSPFPREPPLARAMPRRTQPGIRSACYFGQVEALLEKKSHDDSHSATGQAGTR